MWYSDCSMIGVIQLNCLQLVYASMTSTGVHFAVPQYITQPWPITWCMALTTSVCVTVIISIAVIISYCLLLYYSKCNKTIYLHRKWNLLNEVLARCLQFGHKLSLLPIRELCCKSTINILSRAGATMTFFAPNLYNSHYVDLLFLLDSCLIY